MRTFSPELNLITESSFGSVMHTRNWAASAYRYGFNGEENDNEILAELEKISIDSSILIKIVGGFPKPFPEAAAGSQGFCRPCLAVDTGG